MVTTTVVATVGTATAKLISQSHVLWASVSPPRADARFL
jgi:hypothetical protein